MEHFYHLYADGAWQVPLEEHLDALQALPKMPVTVGLVGTANNCRAAVAALPHDWHHTTFTNGYEQRTLDLLFDRVCFLDGPVLYAHSKGAGNQSLLNDEWRRCMTRNVVSAEALDLVLAGADTVGVHWLTPENHPKTVKIPYYGGNFWWASSAHLLRLPPPSYATRYHAEAWLGTVRPENPVDLRPGWPGAGCASH